MRNRRQAGFTLIELMVTLAVFAILVTVAVPSFRTTIENNRRATTVHGLLGALQLARSEAIKHGNPVTVCAADENNAEACGNNWANGRLVFSDLDGAGDVDDSGDCANGHDCIVRVANPADNGFSFVSTPANPVTYLSSGLVQGAVASAFKISISSCTSTIAKRDRKLDNAKTDTVYFSEIAGS